MKKRPKPAWVVYIGPHHQRLMKRGPLHRTEGLYAFNRGQATEVGALKTDGHAILPESNAVPGGPLWAVDNMEFFKRLAELNPGQWAYFEKKPSAGKLAVLMGAVAEAAEEPEDEKPKAKKAKPLLVKPTPDEAPADGADTPPEGG